MYVHLPPPPEKHSGRRAFGTWAFSGDMNLSNSLHHQYYIKITV